MAVQKEAPAEIAANRRERVLFLRAAGIEVREIAAELGVSKQRVYALLKRAAEQARERTALIQEVRRRLRERC